MTGIQSSHMPGKPKDLQDQNVTYHSHEQFIKPLQLQF